MITRMCLCLALLLALPAASATAAFVEWNNNAGDRFWSNPDNWSSLAVPDTWPERVVGIDCGIPGPIIDETVVMGYPGVQGVNIGDSGSGVGTLTVTGGVLQAGTQGTANYGGFGWIVIGFGDGSNPDAHGVLNIEGGTVEARWDLLISAHGGGDGTINMTGGLLNAHHMQVGWGGGAGQVNLDDGVIALNWATDDYGNGNSFNITETGNIDIENGQLQILGDWRTQMNDFIADNRITGFDGTITPVVDYDNLIAGYTVVYVPEPATLALFSIIGATLIRRRRH